MDFIRTYYKYIIFGVAIILIIIFSIITLLKKDDSDKKKKSLSLSNEKKTDEDKDDYSNKIIIFRESIQDYRIRFFDENGVNLLVSEAAQSLLGIKSVFNKIRNDASMISFVTTKDLNDEYTSYLYDGDELIARTRAYKTKDELNAAIKKIVELIPNDIDPLNRKRDGMLLYKSEVEPSKKPNKKAFDSEIVLDKYRVVLRDQDKKIILVSVPLESKKDIKRMHESLYKEISKGKFYIELNMDKKYRYILKTFTGNIIALGTLKDSMDAVKEEIDTIIKSI